jgi:hypothetical protein
MTDQPSWMTASAVHLPESTSEMFVYQPVGDVDSMWLTAAVDCGDGPLRLEFFTPDHGPLVLWLKGGHRTYEHRMYLNEGSALNIDFATPAQRAAFFRMIVELADWIKEHHSDEAQ